MRICAAGLLVRGDQVLLAGRSAERPFYPGVWDVIGGHCEGDEAPGDALVHAIALGWVTAAVLCLVGLILSVGGAFPDG